jgi:Predicted transcriptional regulator, contains C-terminal CBS domains
MKMKVDDVYTRNPIVVGPETPVPEARRIMEENDIRRLPVVHEGKLVGIVTLTDLLRAAPSSATTLSVWELNYLADKIKVAEIMSRNVITTTPDDDLRNVARQMLAHKIGGMPVMDGDKVVGIITESDIFRAFVKLLDEQASEDC